MSPKTAKFLLEGVYAFQKDLELTAWNGISEPEFFLIIAQISGTDDIAKAVEILEQIAQEKLSPTIPPNLKELVSDLEALQAATEAPVSAEKPVFIQARAATVIARLRAIRPQEGPTPEVAPALPPTPRLPRPAPRRELPPVEVAERPKPRPMPLAPLPVAPMAYLSVKPVREPIVVEVARSALSPITAPFRALYGLSGDELAKTRPDEDLALNFIWRLGITSEEAKRALKGFQVKSPKFTDEHPLIKAIGSQATLLDRYQRRHNWLSRFFRISHGPTEVTIWESLPSVSELRGAKAFQFSYEGGRFSSFARIPVELGLRFAISRGAGRFAQTAVARAVTTPIKKAATGMLVRLGLATITAAPSAGLSLLIWAGIEIVGKIFGWLKDKFREIFTKPERGWIGLLIAAGVVGLGFIFPALAPIFFGFGVLLGTVSLLASFAGAVGSALSGIAATLGGIFSGIAGAVGVSTAVIVGVVAGAVGIPAVLTAYTNLTYQGSFLEEAAAEIPSICLPPTDEFPEPFPPPPGLTFSWPVDLPPACNSPYGYRINSVCSQHEGIDIHAPARTPIEPIAKGTVYVVGYNHKVYGNYVVVQHDGMFSLYAHLDSVNVRMKEFVTSETVLGWAGSTGQSTGSHLHLSVSSCGSVLGNNCFVTNSPNPCLYLTCPGGSTGPSDCVQLDKSVCGEAPICR